MSRRLAEQLELTEEQKPKVDEIMQEAMSLRRALMESMRSGELTREEAMERMRDIQESTTTKLAGVLTEEQMERYRQMMERMRGGFGRRRGGGDR
jgi:hypothetical protein